MLKILIVFCIIILNFKLYSEEIKNKSNYEIYAGVGAGFSNFGVSGSLILYYSIKDISIGIRNIKSQEIHILGKKPNESISEYLLLLGYKTRYKEISITFSSGIGVYYYLERGEIIKGSEVRIPFFLLYSKYESEFKNGYCIPLEIQLLPTNASYSKFGISLFANFNKDRNSYGTLLTFNLGKFK
jgi:hypothetical protein